MATQTVGSSTLSPAVKRQITNIFALGTVLTINALANILPINGVTTGEVSDTFPSLFTPAGYVFSIWGLIYTLLLVFVIYQALPSQKDNPRLERLGYWFAVSCAFNVSWLLAWHYGAIGLSQLLMFGILASLIVCYLRLGVGEREVARAETLAVRLPFSVYLGWITVATVANTSITFLNYGVTGGSFAPFWTVIAIAAAAGIGYLMLRNRRDVAFNLVLVWAFAGIAVKQWGAELLVVIGALVAAAVVVYLIAQNLRGRERFAG